MSPADRAFVPGSLVLCMGSSLTGVKTVLDRLALLFAALLYSLLQLSVKLDYLIHFLALRKHIEHLLRWASALLYSLIQRR